MNTYSTLKQSIADFLARDDLTSYVDTFIDIAEARVGRRLKIRAMEATTTLVCSTSVATIALPTGYAGIRGVFLNGTVQYPLAYNTPEQLNSQVSATGRPRFFSIVGANIQFNCVPDSAYDISMTYFATFTALSDSNTSNWLTTNVPHLLLYGSLQAASEFTQDDAAAQKWASLFQQAIDEAQAADEGEKYGPAPVIKSERHRW